MKGKPRSLSDSEWKRIQRGKRERKHQRKINRDRRK